MVTFKNLVNNFFKIFDARIIRYSKSIPLDLSKEDIHPRTLSYLIDQKPILINLNFKDGRTNRFYSLDEKTFDPYFFSIKQSLNKTNDKEELFLHFLKIIKDYKKIVNIKSFSDYFGIKFLKDSEINSYPVWAIVLPWENIDIKKKLVEFPKSVKADRARNGFIINSNNPSIIMKEDELNSLESHIHQYISLIDSINKKGYVPNLNKGFIEVELLLKNDKFCWKPSGEGNHRSVVVASLGYKNIKAILSKVVRYDEAKYWPNVVNGLYKQEEAELIFDRYLNADLPESHNDWISYCNRLILGK